MSNIETAEIIQFAAIRPKLGKKISSHSEAVSDRPRTAAGYFVKEDGLTDTCQNQRLRRSRHDAWRQADSVMNYWWISMKMDTAISRVQNFGTPEGDLHPDRNPEGWHALVAKYRVAWALLMLTPAPDVRSVTWKRAELKAERYKYTGLRPERIERAVADDVEFLKAHPSRRGGGRSSKPEQAQ
jgi:hypothetical protein